MRGELSGFSFLGASLCERKSDVYQQRDRQEGGEGAEGSRERTQ